GPKLLAGEDVGRDVPIASLLQGDIDFPHRLVDGAHKTLAHFLLHPPVTVDQLRVNAPATDALASHAIDDEALAALLSGDDHTFLHRREALLAAHLRAFLIERLALAPKDRDRLAIEAYLLDESA